MRPLSYSSISTYNQCPLLYKLKYIDGKKEKKKFYLSWGKSLHSALEFLYGVKAPPPPAIAEVMEYYEKNWLTEGYESAEQEEKYRSYGRKILADFYRANISKFRLPLAVEHRFTLEFADVKFTGFFDRVDKLDDGTLAILDYKSNRQIFNKEYLAQALQLTFYQLAAESLWELPVSKMTLYHLRSNTPFSTKPRSADELEQARAMIVNVARNIEAGNFEAKENRFCPCDFPEDCPFYRHSYTDDPVQLRLEPEFKDIDIKQVVEEYVRLKAEIKEYKDKTQRLAAIIQRFGQVENLRRVYGDKHAITLSKNRRLDYDSEAVRQILEPLGLWQQALIFDRSALKLMIADNSIDADVKEKLEMVKTETISTRLHIKNITGKGQKNYKNTLNSHAQASPKNRPPSTSVK